MMLRLSRAFAYLDLGLYKKTLDDATFVINSEVFASESNGNEYWVRALAKDYLGIDSCDDWEKACDYSKHEQGESICNKYYSICY